MADKHKILIVEDDKYIINFISMSLKKEDYDYVIAKTCGEANALFYANRPDMIILDPVSYTHLDVYKRQSLVYAL